MNAYIQSYWTADMQNTYACEGNLVIQNNSLITFFEKSVQKLRAEYLYIFPKRSNIATNTKEKYLFTIRQNFNKYQKIVRWQLSYFYSK